MVESLRNVLKSYWGYDTFLPLQREAMESVMAGRDSLVVLPTGAGKSLCYQAPALCMNGLGVVVSPLISLMKDQVDGLTQCGIAAAAVNSTMSADERRAVARRIRDGSLKLLYAAPERLLADKTLEFLQQQPVSFFAIDEAHCISSWGHDFRPEYRELRRLRDVFPGVAIHAYTATATERVREDIAQQLALRDPQVLAGSFRRRNLTYHVARREGALNQVCSVIDRHRGQSGIVYCISRAECDETSRRLNELGYRTLPYHAGMTDDARRANQDAFIHERVETIVATVAFGMGIDKSNVRYVVHAGMPRSLENYQQESGRAGRDGLEAECWLLYSAQDRMLWRRIISDLPDEPRASAERAMDTVADYCTGVGCRHAALLSYFGEQLDESCQACDVCLGTLQQVDDALTIAQQIGSCVMRVRERFGASHVAQVLKGSRAKQIIRFQHDRLSTWGLLSKYRRGDVLDWIDQLVQQDMLKRTGEYPVLSVTPRGHAMLRGDETPKLLRAVKQRLATTPTDLVDSWEGVDRNLFQALRELRSAHAESRHVPSYIIFSDATLRDLARRRPSSLERLRSVYGVGEKKATEFGPAFIRAIVAYCAEYNVDLDPPVESPGAELTPQRRAARQETERRAFELFRAGIAVEQVAEQIERAVSTTCGYLMNFIAKDRITDATRWLDPYEIERIELAADYAATDRLKPIHDALHAEVDYEHIRITLACRANRTN
ncbi:MAG: DNA helicase RecQ [Planctomycetota bacterium]